MPEVKTEIEINANADTVWNILTDIPAHQHWNSVFTDFKGTAELGRGVKLKVMFAGKKRAFSGRILDCESPQIFAWGTPKSPLDLLISARHYFNIEVINENKVRFVHGEKFGGLIPTLLWPLIRKVEPLYQKMNCELKARAESI